MENINIEQVIHKWFEMKYRTYDKLEYDDSIYLYYKGEKYAEFRIDKKYENIHYNWKLYGEFSEIIPLKEIEFEEFMGKWVEDTFGLEGFKPPYFIDSITALLKMPKINN